MEACERRSRIAPGEGGRPGDLPLRAKQADFLEQDHGEPPVPFLTMLNSADYRCRRTRPSELASLHISQAPISRLAQSNERPLVQ